MPGHGLLIQRYPPSFAPAGEPSSFTTCGTTPGNGFVAEPGLAVIAPGSPVIRIPPVSVCHQVYTIGIFSLPIFLWYHIQASGLIGSPTVPRTLMDDGSFFSTHFSPSFMSARMAVGAV